MVVLMREGTRTVLSMENSYRGPREDFAMVVPVPMVLQRSNVKVLPRDVFNTLERLTAPRLVEYWEQDPCDAQCGSDVACINMAEEAKKALKSRDIYAVQQLVKIEARFAVGEYDVVVLSATDSAALEMSLHENHYKIPPRSEPYLRPYVELEMKFFVAKVNLSKVKTEEADGSTHAVLSPLRFHFDSDSFFLPVRLGLINSDGKQDLIAIILARGQRYEAANYDNVAMVTNLDVDEQAKSQFASFYDTLFDNVVAMHRVGVRDRDRGSSSYPRVPR